MTREAVRAQGLILRHLTYSMKYLIIREGSVKRRQINLREIKIRLGEVARACRWVVHDVLEVLLDEITLIIVVKCPAAILMKTLYEVFSPSTVCPEVEEPCICVSLSNDRNSGALLFFLALSITSQPMIRFFNFARRENSASESWLKSCASSRRSITC